MQLLTFTLDYPADAPSSHEVVTSYVNIHFSPYQSTLIFCYHFSLHLVNVNSLVIWYICDNLVSFSSLYIVILFVNVGNNLSLAKRVRM